MAKGNWAVVPDIRPWRGDSRRNYEPYAICDGMGISAYNLAMFACNELRKRGISCRIELMEVKESQE